MKNLRVQFVSDLIKNCVFVFHFQSKTSKRIFALKWCLWCERYAHFQKYKKFCNEEVILSYERIFQKAFSFIILTTFSAFNNHDARSKSALFICQQPV